jgi:hypothetical protein
MHRRAVFRSATLSVCLTSVSLLAQQLESATASKPAALSPSVRQSAMSLMEEALAGTGSLSLPSNRLAIELRAFTVVWSRSEARARALVQQMAGEIAQAAAAINQDPDQNPVDALNNLRNQRNNIAREIANNDPELALLFVSATLSHLKSIDPDDSSDDHALMVDLAAQVALHNPQYALQVAEQQLKEMDTLPQSMIDLLEQVQRNDPQAGSHLFREIVDHLRGQKLAEDMEALSFAASLLGSQFSRQSEAGKPDDVLRLLAETVATAALSSDVMQNQPYILSNAMIALDALVPSKSAVLHPEERRSAPGSRFLPTFWQRFNNARSTGDSNQVLSLVSQAPENDRQQIVQQAAWDFAGNGDLERTRQVVNNLEPWQRNNVMQLAIRSAALAAGNRSDFPAARQFAAQVTDEESRATLLSELATCAQHNGKTRVAEEMLGEAASLVMNRTASTSAFAAQLKVAQAYLHVKPAEAIPLLERSASQIEQALSAAAQLDGFLPDRHSFEGSELILNQGFLYNSLLQPYAQATAELATVDLPTARTLADRLPLPEARLMTEVFVAAGVLGEKDQTQASNAPDIRLPLDDDH